MRMIINASQFGDEKCGVGSRGITC